MLLKFLEIHYMDHITPTQPNLILIK